MAITDTQVQTLNAYIGEGNVYVGCTKPADGEFIALTAGVPAGGVWVGLTSGDTTVDISQKLEGVDIEQTTGKVAPRVKEETVKVKFKMAEATAAKLALSLANCRTGHDATANIDYVTMGGDIAVDTTCVTIVSPIENTSPQRYEVLCVYAMAGTGTKVPYGRGKTRMFEVEYEAYPDATRTKGDQILQHYQQAA